MKQNLLKTMFLLFALIAGMSSAWATVSTLTFTEACGGTGTTKLDDSDATSGTVTWTVTSDASESSFDSERGIHYGTNSSAQVTYIQLSSSSFTTGTITKVEVEACGANNPSLSVTIGGNAFGTTATGITTSNTKYTFTGSASAGTIIVRLAKSSKAYKALYIKSVAVTYSTGFTVTYNANGATSGTVPTDNSSYASGASVTVKDNTGSLAKSGYTFGGWNTKADGTGDNYTAGSGIFSITCDTTLYAKWNAKTLSSLDYTGTPTKTAYYAGQSFDATGLTVTATYTDASNDNVTEYVVWTPNPLTTGTTSVTGTFMGETIEVSGITVTAIPQFALFAGNIAEGDYLICYDDCAMDTVESSDRLQYRAVTPTDNVIEATDPAIIWHIAKSGDYWTIYNADDNKYAASTGAKNKAQMLASGSDNKSLWTVTGTSTYDFANKANAAAKVNKTLRKNSDYGFACYADGTGGSLSLYKRLAVKLNGSGYATFSSAVPIDYSKASDFTAWKITGVSGETITFEQVTESVAANIGVLLMGTADATIYPTAAATGTDISSSNSLVATASVNTVTAGTYYGLSGNEFVPVNAGEVPGGKALLPVPGGSVKAYTFVFSDASGIDTVREMPMNNGAIYNLAGQRMNSLQKGVNIVNGKKVFVK